MWDVLLYDCGPEPAIEVRAALDPQSFRVATCNDGSVLVENALSHRADAVVYVLRSNGPQDLAVLQLLRRFAPSLPIVVVALETSLAQQRIVQDLRPVYYTVAPVDAAEIRSAVESALCRPHTAALETRRTTLPYLY